MTEELISRALTDVMVVVIGFGVIVGLVVSLFVKKNGVVTIAITLGVMFLTFYVQEVLVDPVSQILYQFLFLVGLIGIAIGVGLLTKLVVLRLSHKDEAE